MSDGTIKFTGSIISYEGQCTFYRSFSYIKNGQKRSLSLGQHFFIQLLSHYPICIGELQLLWQDKASNPICSLRAYFLPEHTQEGRQHFHGDDEVLAVSDKIVLKLEDLVTMIKDGVSWGIGSTPIPFGPSVSNSKAPSLSSDSSNLSSEDASSRVKVFSYSCYCRHRALMKRVEGCNPDLLTDNTFIVALGGTFSGSDDLRILFCRDDFDCPELDDLEIRCDYLLPVTMRKKKMKSVIESGESNEESHSDTNHNHVVPVTHAALDKMSHQVENGKDSPKNGLLRKKDKSFEKREKFMTSWSNFMRSRQTPIGRIPSLGFKQIDIYLFYKYGKKLGGYNEISRKRLWKHLYDRLGGDPHNTSAATCTRKHYEKLILPYECMIERKNTKKKLKKGSFHENIELKNFHDEECKTDAEVRRILDSIHTSTNHKLEVTDHLLQNETLSVGSNLVNSCQSERNLNDETNEREYSNSQIDHMWVKNEASLPQPCLLSNSKVQKGFSHNTNHILYSSGHAPVISQSTSIVSSKSRDISKLNHSYLTTVGSRSFLTKHEDFHPLGTKTPILLSHPSQLQSFNRVSPLSKPKDAHRHPHQTPIKTPPAHQAKYSLPTNFFHHNLINSANVGHSMNSRHLHSSHSTSDSSNSLYDNFNSSPCSNKVQFPVLSSQTQLQDMPTDLSLKRKSPAVLSSGECGLDLTMPKKRTRGNSGEQSMAKPTATPEHVKHHESITNNFLVNAKSLTIPPAHSVKHSVNHPTKASVTSSQSVVNGLVSSMYSGMLSPHSAFLHPAFPLGYMPSPSASALHPTLPPILPQTLSPMDIQKLYDAQVKRQASAAQLSAYYDLLKSSYYPTIPHSYMSPLYPSSFTPTTSQ